MASITRYTTASGQTLWRVRYRKPNRKQTDKRGFTTKRDATLWASKMEASKAEGTFVDSTAGRVAVGVLAEAWFASRTGIRPQTLRGYRDAYRLHVAPTFAEVRVAEVTRAMVRSWIADLSSRRGASVVKRAVRVLASILDDAVEDQRIPRNPARGHKMPANRARKNVYLTIEQVEALAHAARDEYRVPVYLAAYCGLRFGEILALTASDVDVKHRQLLIDETMLRTGKAGDTKSGKPRTIGFPEFLSPMLAAAVLSAGDDARLFHVPHPREKGWWGTARAKAGLPDTLTFHDLRHTAASLAVRTNASVKVIQNMLGHASATTTLDTYADLWEADVDVIADRINAARGQIVGTS